MTTIAYKNKTLCADSQLTLRNTKNYDAIKLITKGDVAVAAAGCSAFAEFTSPIIAKHAVKSKTPRKLLDKIRKDPRLKRAKWPTTFIVLHPKYLITIWECDRFSSFNMRQPHAWGSGEVIAYTAMLAGYSAKKAVKLAAKHDCYTGGKVITHRMKK